MMSTEAIVGLHFEAKEDITEHDRRLNEVYSAIILGVQAKGHPVVITRGNKHIDPTERVAHEAWRPDFSKGQLRTKVIGAVGLQCFGVIRDYDGRLDCGGMPPLINEPSVIDIDHSKWEMYQLASGLQVATARVNSHTVSEVSALQGDTLIVKPDHSAGGRDIFELPKDMVEAMARGNPSRKYITQEVLDLNHPFPREIKGIDDTEIEKLNALKDRKKEIRMYIFSGRGHTKTIPAARLFKEGTETDDTWIGIDVESIPEELYTNSEILASRLTERAKVAEIHGALDWCYSTAPGDSEPRWRLMEGNYWNPLGKMAHPETARLFDNAMVEQLVRIAQTPLHS